MYGKTKTLLHLSDDRKVSESFAQTPAKKFYFMYLQVRSLSRAALQLVRGSQRSHDEKGRAEPAALPFSSLWLLAAFLYIDHPLLCSACKFPVQFPLGPLPFGSESGASVEIDVKAVKTGSASLYGTKEMWPLRFSEHGSCNLLGPESKVICAIPGKRCRVGISTLGQVPPTIKFENRWCVLWLLRRTRKMRKIAVMHANTSIRETREGVCL